MNWKSDSSFFCNKFQKAGCCLKVSVICQSFVMRGEICGSYLCLKLKLIFWVGKKNVKHTLVQALRLSTGRTVHRGSRGIALPFHDRDTRKWWGVSVTPRPLFTPRKDPVAIVQEAAWAPGPVWAGAENLAPTRIRSQDRPARSYTDWATRPNILGEDQ